jgi:hypothetical protein
MLNVCWKRQVIPSKETELMSSDSEEFNVGDSVLIVGTDLEGELGTIIAITPRPEGRRYLVVFENGSRGVFDAENLSHRR